MAQDQDLLLFHGATGDDLECGDSSPLWNSPACRTARVCGVGTLARYGPPKKQVSQE
jgi:hypothetical protein